MPADRFNLQRSVDAQAPVWQAITAELRAGHKRTHWMWFAFLQLALQVRSSTAKLCGLVGVEETRAHPEHPVLGERLREVCSREVALVVELSVVWRPLGLPPVGVHDGLPQGWARTVSSRGPRLDRSEGCLPAHALPSTDSIGCLGVDPTDSLGAARSGRRNLR